MADLVHNPTFWVAVAFVIFVGLTFKPLAKAMGGGLDKRSDQIRQELEEAAQLREEAQRTLAEYKKMQSEAAREAERRIEAAEDQPSGGATSSPERAGSD